MDTVSSEQLEEIIGRLTTLERKLDWVAKRISRDGYPLDSAARPQPRPAPVASPPARPITTRTSSSSPAAAPAVQQPRTPALATYPPSKPVLKAPSTPSQKAPTAVAPSGATSAADSDPFAMRPMREKRNEGNIGRYVLSGAAAFLIVSAAVSLIALVWDQIPDVVKVTALGVVAVSLVAAGTVVNQKRERLQVAAATLTGTGGALGFVAVIGAALIAGLSPVAALGLMVAWAFVLLLVSCVTAQFFTAVISMLGALVTVGFTTWQVATHPEQAVLAWTLIDIYTVTLAVVAAILPRFTPRMRLAPWLPTTSMVVTGTVLLAGPSRLLVAQPLTGIVLLAAPCAVLLAQAHHSTRLLAGAGAREAAGYEWAVTGIIQALALLILASANDVTSSTRNGMAMSFLVLVCLATAALLPQRATSPWLRVVAAVNLGTVVCVAAAVFALNIALLPPAVAAVALAAVPVVRVGYSAPVLVLPLFSTAALLAVFSPDRSTVMLAILAVLIGVLPTAPLEALLAPPPHSEEHANRPSWLSAGMWVAAGQLVLIIPRLLDRLVPAGGLGGAGRIAAPLLAGALALALAGMGAFTPQCSPRMLVSGRRAGQLAGATDLRSPLVPTPPALAWLGEALLTALAVAVLVRADSLGSPLLAAPLVALALALVVVGGRMLLPWLRHSAMSLTVTLTIALSQSLALWWSVMILTGASAASLLITGVVLATGAACIVIGFRLRATTLRHYGLTLVLLVVFKLAVVDLAGQNSLSRILALMVAGVVCFGLSLAYNHFAQEQEQAEHGAIGADSAGGISPAGRGGSSYPR
ncbi:DUF2339 domain-containing protein [Actinomyces glycerinitolerans]|uniref:DUF2339 domain-containing protein n=1 Tax=Actinomyces glycerinitolerans TaxID=1892869 RepID=A0A1M4S226_9ACTO|nr:DUF2339 domain-containing protein [Actinomyces glycerinitolerans]SHE26219.1 Hypothetical protein ACGLYG10_2467 [Actinomyces glycerinitolerans]